MDWILNREIAALIWIFLVACFALIWKGARRQAIQLVISLFNPRIIIVIAIGGLFTNIFFQLLEPDSGWTPRQNWLAFYWYFTVGTSLIVSAALKTNEASYKPILNLVTEGIKFTAVIEFIANTQSMHLLIELALVPVLFILIFSTQTQISDKIPANVLRLYKRALIAIPIVVLVVSIISIFYKPAEFFSVDTLRDFLVPLILTVCHLIFLCFLYIYTNYENAYIRIQHQIKNPFLVRYAFCSAVTSYGPMLKRLGHWVNVVQIIDPKNPKEVEFTLNHGNLLTPLKDLFRTMPR